MCEDFSEFVLKESFHYQICSYFSACWKSETPHLVLPKEKIQSNHSYELWQAEDGAVQENQ